MVVGERFVWGHLPKAAGDTTLALFRLFPELIVSADAEKEAEKHNRFKNRPETRGKQRALNLRRLPAWILSYSAYTALHGVYPDHKPLPFASPHQMAESRLPDEHLAPYFEDGGIDCWLRVEHLKDDFLAFVSQYVTVDQIRLDAVEALNPVNTLVYDRDLSHWFTQEHVERMYEANPVWAEVEERLYGDRLPFATAQESFAAHLRE